MATLPNAGAAGAALKKRLDDLETKQTQIESRLTELDTTLTNTKAETDGIFGAVQEFNVAQGLTQTQGVTDGN